MNRLSKKRGTRFCLVAANSIAVNLGFVMSYLLRYGAISVSWFAPYRESWPWLTVLYLASLAVCGVYKHRFRSSWELFRKITLGTLASTVAGLVFMYIFRTKWGAFPSSIFAVSVPVNIVLLFKTTQWILRKQGAIQKKIIVIGNGDIRGLAGKTSIIHRIRPDEFRRLKTDFEDLDQIIIAEEIKSSDLMQYLTLLTRHFGLDLAYSPVVYMKLINERFNGNGQHSGLKTFEGQRRDAEEYFIRLMDIAASISGLVLLSPVIAITAAAVKTTSSGPAIYRQIRVGKDGKPFVIFKFRTMYQDAEKLKGFQPALIGDKRITSIGRFLRRYRIDEIPQLINILKGEMSLVGPRPENVFRVNSHKALQGIRLAVKPGLTGLAQIRGLYDLRPGHKLKYDYLYIQRRSLRLNAYILLNTLPVLFKKQGW